jgi:hypothetical protein
LYALAHTNCSMLIVIILLCGRVVVWWGRWDLNPRLLASRLRHAGTPAPQVHRRVRLWYPVGDNRCLDQARRRPLPLARIPGSGLFTFLLLSAAAPGSVEKRTFPTRIGEDNAYYSSRCSGERPSGFGPMTKISHELSFLSQADIEAVGLTMGDKR